MATDARPIDALDRGLLQRLRVDGREANRSLALALGVNEATVAARLRRMEAANVMHIVALTDMAGFGYDFFAFAFVRVVGRGAIAVARDLAEIPQTSFVNVVTGRYDIVCGLLARDREELGRLVGEAMPQIQGVTAVCCEVTSEALRFDPAWAALAAGDAPDEPPHPVLSADAVDELDLAIIKALQRDARSSNRSIAAELAISEGTIRSRLRRMEDERLIRICAVSDVGAFRLEASATVGVHAAGGAVQALGPKLVAVEHVGAVLRTVGQFDFLLAVAGETRSALMSTILGTLQELEEVAAVEVFDIAAVIKHVYTWVALIDEVG